MKDIEQVHRFQEGKIEELPKDEQELLGIATLAMVNAYNPYSEFRVGAAVQTKTGETYKGCNSENMAFNPTICAERAAIASADSDGHSHNLAKIAVIGRKDELGFVDQEIVTPCGTCRQVIKEHEDLAEEPMVIIMASVSGKVLRTVGIENLLPYGFGPECLKQA